MRRTSLRRWSTKLMLSSLTLLVLSIRVFKSFTFWRTILVTSSSWANSCPLWTSYMHFGQTKSWHTRQKYSISLSVCLLQWTWPPGLMPVSMDRTEWGAAALLCEFRAMFSAVCYPVAVLGGLFPGCSSKWMWRAAWIRCGVGLVYIGISELAFWVPSPS